jgi:IS5 family transposase
VHSVRGTSGNVSDVVMANSLLHGEEDVVFADSGYPGAVKRPYAKPGMTWQIARRPSSRKPFENSGKLGQIID